MRPRGRGQRRRRGPVCPFLTGSHEAGPAPNAFAGHVGATAGWGMRCHAGQLAVSTEAVRELVGVQFPQWRDLPVSAVASHGTVNAIFRIGAGLAARFPLQPADVASTRRWLEAEAAAARLLVGRTRFGTPEPMAIGEPGAGYPLPWSVQTWLPGPWRPSRTRASVAFARDLADFVHDVRVIDTGGRTFDGTNRGGDLRSRDAWMETCFRRSEELLDVAWLRRPGSSCGGCRESGST